MAAALPLARAAFTALRRLRPILRLGKLWVVTRHDDVLEVFAEDPVYRVPYHANLQVITRGEPFFLSMDDTPEYHAQIAAMRTVVLPSDLEPLGVEAETLARDLVARSDGRVEVVTLVRQVAFALMGRYFGIGEPPGESLAFWGSRLFEFQFTGSVDDAAWRAEAETLAAKFSSHVARAIAARKAMAPVDRSDDVLSRCLALQAEGRPGYSDVQIGTAIMCLLVGGPPQAPMVMPQAVEQLMRRPEWLAAAQAAAREGEDDRLRALIEEAMRFDPLAPGFRRIALKGHELASGTGRARHIPEGATVFAATASAMMDPRRVGCPERFDPSRPPRDYLHFGHGLHQCFGRYINHATLHRMVKPLLAQPGLGRAAGRAGRLEKRGPFAHRLELTFDFGGGDHVALH